MDFLEEYKTEYTKLVKNVFKKSEKNQKLFLSFYDIVFLNKKTNLESILDLDYEETQLESLKSIISKLFLIVLRDYTNFLIKNKSIENPLMLLIQKNRDIDKFLHKKSEEEDKHINIDSELLSKLSNIEKIFDNLEDDSRNDSFRLLEIVKTRDLKVNGLILIHGVPAKFEVEVISILSDKIILKIISKNAYYNRAVNVTNMIYLLTPISKKVIVGHCIETKGFVHVRNMQFLKYGSPFDRKALKINLIHENLDVTIINSTNILGKILDLSLNSMSILLKDNEEIERGNLYEIEFVLDSKILKMEVEAIKSINFENYKIIVMLFTSQLRAFENIINGFMHRKQLEIIDKLRNNRIETKNVCLI